MAAMKKLLGLILILVVGFGSSLHTASAYTHLALQWDHNCLTTDGSPQITAALAKWAAVANVRDCGVSASPDLRLLKPDRNFAQYDLVGVAECYTHPGTTVLDYCNIRIRLDFIDSPWVAAHEVGHAIGMGHSDVPGTVMWPNWVPWANDNGDLHPDDVAGAVAIYGPVKQPIVHRWAVYGVLISFDR